MKKLAWVLGLGGAIAWGGVAQADGDLEVTRSIQSNSASVSAVVTTVPYETVVSALVENKGYLKVVKSFQVLQQLEDLAELPARILLRDSTKVRSEQKSFVTARIPGLGLADEGIFPIRTVVTRCVGDPSCSNREVTIQIESPVHLYEEVVEAERGASLAGALGLQLVARPKSNGEVEFTLGLNLLGRKHAQFLERLTRRKLFSRVPTDAEVLNVYTGYAEFALRSLVSSLEGGVR